MRAELLIETGVLLIRTELDRILVRADYAAEVEARDGSLDGLLHVPGDRVRDLSPAVTRLWPGARWWSLTCAAELIQRGRPPAYWVARPKARFDPNAL
jgi:hypothetical protein